MVLYEYQEARFTMMNAERNYEEIIARLSQKRSILMDIVGMTISIEENFKILGNTNLALDDRLIADKRISELDSMITDCMIKLVRD